MSDLEKMAMVSMTAQRHEAMKACVDYVLEHERKDFIQSVIQPSESFRDVIKKARDHVYFQALLALGGAYEADTDIMEMWREQEKYR